MGHEQAEQQLTRAMYSEMSMASSIENLRVVAADALRKKDEDIFILSQSAESYLSTCGELDGEVLGLREAHGLMKHEYEKRRSKSA